MYSPSYLFSTTTRNDISCFFLTTQHTISFWFSITLKCFVSFFLVTAMKCARKCYSFQCHETWSKPWSRSRKSFLFVTKKICILPLCCGGMKFLASRTLMLWGIVVMFYKHQTTEKNCRTFRFFSTKLSVQMSYKTFVMLPEPEIYTRMRSGNRFPILECHTCAWCDSLNASYHSFINFAAMKLLCFHRWTILWLKWFVPWLAT